MGQEFVMQGTRVLFDLNQVDCHGGHLGYHDATQGVGHCQVSLVQLKLGRIPGQLQDLNLAGPLVVSSQSGCVLEVLVESNNWSGGHCGIDHANGCL